MALTATIYRLSIDLSDVDAGRYERLELRLARHPSESGRYLVTRALAYALSFEEGITFGKGLGVGEDPPVEVRDLRGERTHWIDVGNPTFDRVHKASKGTSKVSIWTHQPELLRRDLRGRGVHKADRVGVFALPAGFLDELERATERNATWELTRNDGQLYVVVNGQSLSAALERTTLDEPAE